jgi:hypothetical protein
VATRALEALETGSVAVHDALHSLLECCLQLHPAAARHLYEAAKKVWWADGRTAQVWTIGLTHT